MKGEFFITYLPSLMPLALRLTNNEHDAEDLLQDVAEKLLKSNIDEKPIEDQKKICYAAVRNFHYSNITKRKTEKRDSSNYSHSQFSRPEAYAQLQLAELFDYVSGLTGKSQAQANAAIAQARGYSMAEIGKLQGTTLTGTLTRVRSGRRLLKKSLA